MELRFTVKLTKSVIPDVVSLLRSNGVCVKAYPGYELWLTKVARELASGVKKAVVCWDGKKCVGVIVYQRHKVMLNVVEINNLTILPRYYKRIVTFLFKLAEKQALHILLRERRPSIMCDTRSYNHRVCRLLKELGYRPIGLDDLYGHGELDVVFIKSYWDLRNQAAP